MMFREIVSELLLIIGSAVLLGIFIIAPADAFADTSTDVSQELARPFFGAWTLNRSTGTFFSSLTLTNISTTFKLLGPFAVTMSTDPSKTSFYNSATRVKTLSLDITSGVLAAHPLGLFPGETVTIANIEVFDSTRLSPPDSYFSVSAVASPLTSYAEVMRVQCPPVAPSTVSETVRIAGVLNGTSALKIRKGTNTYGIELVDAPTVYEYRCVNIGINQFETPRCPGDNNNTLYVPELPCTCNLCTPVPSVGNSFTSADIGPYCYDQYRDPDTGHREKSNRFERYGLMTAQASCVRVVVGGVTKALRKCKDTDIPPACT